jgi:hypothetical protein
MYRSLWPRALSCLGKSSGPKHLLQPSNYAQHILPSFDS